MTSEVQAGAEVVCAERFHKILSLDVTGGGFLDGVRIELSPHLNCLIGGRGTGKTTAIEFLRFVLKEPIEAGERPERRELQKLVASNLRTGTIRARIETRDGLRYVVERSAEGEAEVFDERGRPTGLSLDTGAVFDLDVFSQSEVEGIAEDPIAQLALIDRFVGTELRELNEKLRAVGVELQANAAECQTLTTQVRELTEVLGELPVVHEKLKASKAQGPSGSGAVELNEALSLKGLREREVRVVEAVERHLAAQREALAQLTKGADAAEGLVGPQARRGPNGKIFDDVASILGFAREEVAARALQAQAAVDTAARRLAEQKARLGTAHQAQEVHYRQLLAKYEQEKGRAKERLQLERRLHELQDRQRQLEERRAALQDRLERRAKLLGEVESLAARRSSLREGVARQLTADLAPTIRVTIAPGGDQREFREVLSKAFRGSGRPYTALVQRVAAAAKPRELARLIAAGAEQELVEDLGLEPEQARRFVAALRDSPVLYEVEALALGDLPTIELKDGEEFKPTHALSTGQKCTTILPILLLESERPLLIDQPEDHLDGTYVYEVIVDRLRRVKKHRQLILVTHNPNIPVLGDAERVVVLRSSGARSTVVAAGGVDDVKAHVATILEGGRAAFEARQKRYGY